MELDTEKNPLMTPSGPLHELTPDLVTNLVVCHVISSIKKRPGPRDPTMKDVAAVWSKMYGVLYDTPLCVAACYTSRSNKTLYLRARRESQRSLTTS